MPYRLRRRLALFGFCAALFAQAPETGAIEGDVADGVTRKPLPGTRIKLQAGERTIFARCDGNGRFQFLEIAPGTYSVTANRPGYFPAAQLVRPKASPAGAPAQVHLAMDPYGAIAGRVVDSAGVPVEGADVELLRHRPGDPKMALAANARTNDLGEYRFASRGPGSYYVLAHPRIHRDDTDETERPTYYPRALRPELARPAEVAKGQEVTGIDIQLVRQAGVRVTGRVIPPADSPRSRTVLVNTAVVAWRPDGQPEDSRAFPNGVREGAFELANLLPGRYLIEALTSDVADFGQPRTLLAGSRTIEVQDKDVDGVEIPMLPPAEIPGAVVFAEGCPAVPVSIKPVVATRLTPVAAQMAGTAAGSFTLTGLIPGRYTLAIAPGADPSARYRYSAASAKLGEDEVLQAGFELAGRPPGALRIAIACSPAPGMREVVR